MIWTLYNILFVLLFPLMLPHFLWRMCRRGGYSRNFLQRVGVYSSEVREALGGVERVWLHAVSVGELYVAIRLMKEWREREPGVRFALTTTTSTAYAIANRELAAPDVALYFPVDFPPVMRRVFEAIRPRALVLVEVELWPNLIRMAHERALPVLLINGRMSDRSFRGYGRLKPLVRRVLAEFDLVGVQSDEDRRRFIALGADPVRTVNYGSAKYDVALATPPSGSEQVQKTLRAAGVTSRHLTLLGGSTWPGEEEAMVDLYRGLKTRYRNLVLILVPRHVERVPAIVEALKPAVGRLVLRSSIRDDAPPAASAPDVLLVDTTGELKHFYAHADVIFVGKSLVQHGGQNIIEPALFGRPIVVGPNMENFVQIMADFREADAILQVKDLQGLRRAVDDLLCDPGKRRAMGESARRVVEEKAGSITAFLDQLQDAGIVVS